MISGASDLSIINYRGIEYIKGPIQEIIKSILMPYLKGQQIEVLGLQFQGERPEVIGVGDRFEEGCAFINL